MRRSAATPSAGAAPEQRDETARAGRTWTASQAIDEFTAAWERGESPRAEDYLSRLEADPASSEAVELIYREYCLAEADGLGPAAPEYLARFPRQREALERLLWLHSACTVSLLGRLAPSAAEMAIGAEAGAAAMMPAAGDSIGPYVLRRELGRGGFARVFLAEQSDLENRPVVVKVSTRATREPWLLARARHPHIVEVLSHSLVDDGAFQLICMPFFGGATLDAVLAARRGRNRGRGRRARPGTVLAPTSGRDLLEALDRTAAPEYFGATSSRPARELIARLSYDRAAAWIAARLGEALDHAFRCGVAHGDVKPSNVLLAADGNPMLLDFNLARGGAEGPSAALDPGGTLAYMPPERLRALAGPSDRHETAALLVPIDRERDLAPHRADIYALGMVLLELLTGRPPMIVKASRAAASGETSVGPSAMAAAGPVSTISRAAEFRSAAAIYARVRERNARALIDRAAAAAGRPIAPGLRTVLERCLDPNPDRRYGRAFELVEDLDRWRCDRPLAFADEPFWRQRVPRWARRQRRALAVAAFAFAIVVSIAFAVYWRGAGLVALKTQAQGKLARLWDRARSRSYREMPARTLRLLRPDEPWVVDAARQALEEYSVLGPGERPGAAAPRWHDRDDVRRLDDDDRQDLEAWLIERAYRYARALEVRPRSTEDWPLALAVLEAATRGRAFAALRPLRGRLAARAQGESARAAPDITTNITPHINTFANLDTNDAVPAWLEEHLLGFVAECEEPEDFLMRESGEGAPAARRGPLEAEAFRQDRAATRALEHYRKSLALRPGSYWGHYRAAGVCYALGLVADAAGHLQHCLERRPDGVLIHGMLAGCLVEMRSYSDALALCDQALAHAPDHAEFYRTRAFVRRELGQAEGLREDLRRLDVHWQTGELPNSPRHRPEWGPFDELPIAFWAAAHTAPARRAGRASSDAEVEGPEALGPGSIEDRLRLVDGMRAAGDVERAEELLDRLVRERPDHVAARMKRVACAVADRRFEAARRDLEAVRARADLIGVLRDTIANRFTPFFIVTHEYLKASRHGDAERIARFAVDLAVRIDEDIAKARYNLAQVHAVQARLGAPGALEQTAEQLRRAFAAAPFLERWYREDRWWLSAVRPQIDAVLRDAPMPTPPAPRSTTAEPHF